MDGKTIFYNLEHILREGNESTLLDDKTSWDYIWKAAIQFVKRTRCLSKEQTITTVATQRAYDLGADYLGLYLTDTYNRYFIKYNDGTNDRFILWREYDAVVYGNVTQTVAIPLNFSIKDRSSGYTALTGAATVGSTGTTLVDTAAPFASVLVGDTAYNTTDGSEGIVTGVTSSSQLTAVLFNGTGNDWGAGDAYVIVPQGIKQLVLDPPPSTTGNVMTVYSLKRPDPVYSDYGIYPFDSQYALAIAHYAAWLYKYREEKPSIGDALYKYWEMEVREAIKDTNKSMNRMGYKVIKYKRAYSDRSFR